MTSRHEGNDGQPFNDERDSVAGWTRDTPEAAGVEFESLFELRDHPTRGWWTSEKRPTRSAERAKQLLRRGARVSARVLVVLADTACPRGFTEGMTGWWRVPRGIWDAAPLNPERLVHLDDACVVFGRQRVRCMITHHPDADVSVWRHQLARGFDSTLIKAIEQRVAVEDVALAGYCRWLIAEDARVRARAAEESDATRQDRFWRVVTGIEDPGPIPDGIGG